MAARVALFLVNERNEYQRLIRKDAEVAARRSGLSLEVFSADDDSSRQVQQLKECVRGEDDARPQAVVVYPVRDASLYRLGQDAVRAGLAWVLLNRRPEYVGQLQREFPDAAIGVVGPDQVDAGRLQGRQVRTLLPSGGYLLYVMGPALSSAAQDRLAGLQDELRGSSVDVSQVYGEWLSDVAEQAVGDWLRIVLQARLRLNLVVCQNDAMALGARDVLDRIARETDRPELLRIPVTGFDGDAAVGQRLVNDGRLAATIIQPSSGGPAIEWLAKALRGERVARNVVLPVTSYPELQRLAPNAGR